MRAERVPAPKSRTLGELRRFELKTNDPEEIEELDRVIEEKHLTREDLGIILLYLGVRPGIDQSAFDIHRHNSLKHLSDI